MNCVTLNDTRVDITWSRPSMKILRKIFRSKKKRHAVNKRSRKSSSKKRISHDAHLLRDDFLFGYSNSSRRHRRKHKVGRKEKKN